MHIQCEAVGPLLLFDTGIGPNSSALCTKFVKEISDALQKVKANESTILLRETSMHTVRNDAMGRCDCPT